MFQAPMPQRWESLPWRIQKPDVDREPGFWTWDVFRCMFALVLQIHGIA
jgi:hypothetical protein